MKEKLISTMEKVAMKLISMWQVDVVIALAGVAIFYLVQRWREKEERKRKVEEAVKKIQELENEHQDRKTGRGVSPQTERVEVGRAHDREFPPEEDK